MSKSSMSPSKINLLYTAVSLILMALSIPLLLEKIGPNGLYGLRTAKTMSNPTIWYAANKVAGMDLLIAGGAILLTTLAVFAFGKNLSANKVALIDLGVTVVALAVAIGHSASVLSGM